MADQTFDSVADRRDSPRVAMRFLIRSAGEGEFQEHDGDLSLGGISFPGEPSASRYEIRFRLPNREQELLVLGEPISREEGKGRVQLRFVELDTPTELTIARYFDELAGTVR